MDSMHISKEIMFRMGNETISFSRDPLFPSRKPTEEQIQKNVTGIQLSYAHCGEQDGGIELMMMAFGAGADGIIKKVPKELILDTLEDVTILKYGSTDLHPRMIQIAKQVGMAGYWDDSNLIICSSKEYNTIIKNSLNDLIKPEKAMFATRKAAFGGGINLMILAV